MNVPCKGCSDRSSGCHSRCPMYRIYNHHRSNVLADKHKAQCERYDLQELKADGIKRQSGKTVKRQL